MANLTSVKPLFTKGILVSKIITSATGLFEETGSQGTIFSTAKDRLDFYRREIHFETTNLSSRTNAYLASQSFLVIAYASSMANLNAQWGLLFTMVVPVMLALFGALSSGMAWPGMKASCAIIDHWHFKQSGFLRSDPLIGLAYDDSPLFSSWESTDKGHKPALRFSKQTPWMFFVFWMCLGGFTVFVHITHPAL
ncbi:hypothetical protein [Pseudomonas huanghezhanensis]|uniref:hypothetical protein n=1 Tax=Pseudomonas huanghezhanensis TaxID=3002903 RepID=UPI0022864C3B|nr:hypothetical protein [Pseudomonas sp. BSw22131]